MTETPSIIYTAKTNIIFVLVVFIWTFLFAVAYTPTFGLSQEHMDIWYAHDSLSIPILCSICSLTLALSRTLLCLLPQKNRPNEIEYLIWQFCELVIICFFSDLFLCLYLHQPYFKILPSTLLIGFLILAIPYTLYWLYAEKKDADAALAQARTTIEELRKGLDRSAEPAPIKFTDEKGQVKLVMGADHIISIESAGNYVTIRYENNGKLTLFALRNTLKSIEELCNANGLVRCHRSWVVNLRKIRLLRKDPEGVFAEINFEGVDDIPVSKNYAADVVERLSSL